MRIRNKLIVSFGFVAAVAVLSVSLLGYYTAKKIILQQMFSAISEQILVAAGELGIQYQNSSRKAEQDLRSVEMIIDNLGSAFSLNLFRKDNLVINKSSNNNIRQEVSLPKILINGKSIIGNEDFLKIFKEMTPSYITIFQIFDDKLIRILTTYKSGSEMTSTIEIGEYCTGDYFDADSVLYRNIIRGNPFIGLNRVHGRGVLTAAKPIYSKNGVILGAIAVEIKPERIERVKDRAILHKIGKNGYIEIFDSTGLQLIHNTREGDIRSDINHKKMIHLKNGIIRAAMTGDALDAMENYYTEKYYIFTYIPESDWYIAANVYVDDFLDPVYSLRNNFFLIAVISIILIMLVSYFLSRRILRPIDGMLKTIHNLVRQIRIRESSELRHEITLPTIIDEIDDNSVYKHRFIRLISKVVGHDEIKVFAANLGLMAESLLQSFSQIDNQMQQIREANEEIRKSKDELHSMLTKLADNEKFAMISTLVASIAHDVSSPLGISITALSYFENLTHTIEKNYKLAKVTKTDFEVFINHASESTTIIGVNLQRAFDLMRSFKDMIADQCNEEKRVFNVGEYLSDILLSLKPKLKTSTHTVNLDCPPDIVLNSFPGAFSQIITNLIINSVVHGFEDMKNGIISLSIKSSSGMVELYYHDNGKGISPEHINVLFDPFFTTKRGRGGTGLGTHIIHRTVTKTLNGTIRCESEVGNGTTFYIQFPE